MAHSLSTLPMQRLERQVVSSSVTTLRFPASGPFQQMKNLPSGSRHIAITIIGKNRADDSAEDYNLIRFNGDSGNNYNMIRYDCHTGDNQTGFTEYGVTSFSQAGHNCTGNHADTANIFQASTWLFPHALIDTGFDNTFLAFGGNPDNAFTAASRLRLGHGWWDDDGSHDPIEYIEFIMSDSGNWADNTVATLAVVDEDYNSNTETVSGSDGTITHGSLGASPENIAIISTVKGSRDYTIDALEVQLNADTTASNFAATLIDAREGTVSSGVGANNSSVEINGSGSTTAADHAGNHLIQIQQSGNTTGRGSFYSLSGHVDDANAGDFDAALRIGAAQWANTATVTSVKFEGESSGNENLKVGSTSDLYISHPAEYLLDSKVVSSVAYLDFDLSDYDIPDCSTDLKLIIYGAGDSSDTGSSFNLQFAAEGGSIDTTASNYFTQNLTYASDASVAGAVTTSNASIGRVPGASGPHSDQMGGATVTVFEWANTGMHKPFHVFGSSVNSAGNTTDIGSRIYVGRWANTAAIGNIRITGDSDGTDFRDGTVVELYSTYGTDAAIVSGAKTGKLAKVNGVAPHSATEQQDTRVNGILI